MRQLLAELDRRAARRQSASPSWHEKIDGWRKEWQAFIAPKFEIHSSPIRPERVVADCRAVLPDDAIISLDSGVHHNWFMQFWEARRPQTMLNTWGFSGMGFGPCGILGAKLAAPDRPCVSICGDGGFTMVPHVLCTAVEYDIPAVWVVWNNFAWARSATSSTACSTAARSAPAFIRAANRQPYNPDFAAWARAAGVEGITVSISPGFRRRARPCPRAGQALPDRRARGRQGPAARNRHLAAAAHAVQGAHVRQSSALHGEIVMAQKQKPKRASSNRKSSIRNIAEVDWEDLAGHFGGAYSKFLVHPDTTGAQHVDYRISCYQPRAYVELHAHKIQEQIYHVLEGEGVMQVGARRQVVRRHDVIFITPGVKHAIFNTGITDLIFIVVTTPPRDA